MRTIVRTLLALTVALASLAAATQKKVRDQASPTVRSASAI